MSDAAEGTTFTIAHLSDLHCGGQYFVPGLLERAIAEINDLKPDIVVCSGDLTTFGFKHEYEEARRYLDKVECEAMVVIPGNHDSRNVGYVHFEELFGDRNSVLRVGPATVVAVDSTEPDLDHGQIGRGRYRWIEEQFAQAESRSARLRLPPSPAARARAPGRERNVIYDAGDTIECLQRAGVHLVLSGHKHVPYAWKLENLFVVNTGTVSSLRLRGQHEALLQRRRGLRHPRRGLAQASVPRPGADHPVLARDVRVREVHRPDRGRGPTPPEGTTFTIAHLSDLHCGGQYFVPGLLERAIAEINDLKPDIVVCSGDLTTFGFKHEYEEARRYLDKVECEAMVVIPGNHDSRNVGYVHFEELFGDRNSVLRVGAGDRRRRRLDRARPRPRPDRTRPLPLDRGAVRASRVGCASSSATTTCCPCPGTGRERNVIYDAGDTIECLQRAGVHLVLSGHKHVPYAWKLEDLFVVNTGTVSSLRLRGNTRPCYNVVEVSGSHVAVWRKHPFHGQERIIQFSLETFEYEKYTGRIEDEVTSRS